MHDEHAESQDMARCAACAARLSHDQRYCVECGARRGPLPAPVAERLGAMFEQGSPAAGPQARAPEREPAAEKAPWAPAITMPTPRAAAAGVLAMLAFGVLIGS